MKRMCLAALTGALAISTMAVAIDDASAAARGGVSRGGVGRVGVGHVGVGRVGVNRVGVGRAGIGYGRAGIGYGRAGIGYRRGLGVAAGVAAAGAYGAYGAYYGDSSNASYGSVPGAFVSSYGRVFRSSDSVYGPSGGYVGSDPDARVRDQLARDPSQGN
jgi:hypothetical protein